MQEIRIGDVTHFYDRIHVAAVRISDGELHRGDTIHIKGRSSDFVQEVGSMEREHEPVDVAMPGDYVGILMETGDNAHERDEVYLVRE